MPSAAIADPTTLVNARRANQAHAQKQGHATVEPRRSSRAHSAPAARPHLTPLAVPGRQTRRAPLAVRINSALKTTLIALCGLAIAGYGFDVARTNDMTRMQEQARRLSEQNSELSAQLLKAISFEKVQDSALGRAGLRVPEHVLIVKEVAPPKLTAFHPSKHHLPIMSGY